MGRRVTGRVGAEGETLVLRFEVETRHPSGHDKLVEPYGLGLLFDVADFGTSTRKQVHVWIEDERVPTEPSAR